MKQFYTILFILLYGYSFSVQAKTIYVNANSQSGYFTNIQKAINSSQPGDTVQIFQGIYNQSFAINKNIVVTGCNLPNTIINSSNSSTIFMHAGTLSCLNIKSENHHGVVMYDNTVIKNCVIQGCENTNNTACGGIRYNGTNIIIKNCIIQNSGYHGIVGNGNGKNATITNCIFLNNKHHAGYSYNNATVKCNFNCYYKNEVNSWGWQGGLFIGDSSIKQDPKLDNNFKPLKNSPVINTGNNSIIDVDHSRSDMGIYGGPDSCSCHNINKINKNSEILKLTYKFNLVIPNPIINNKATINYYLASKTKVTLTINNYIGQPVIKLLKNKIQKSKKYSIPFDTGKLQSGLYFCILQAGHKIITDKIIIIK